MAGIPANVATARLQAITTDYYALGYLALCAAAYSDEAASPHDIASAIALNVSNIGQVGNVPGTWILDWGPAITASPLSWKANLLFVASYRDPASKLPIFSAVVLRGTDTRAGFLGVLTQMKEDLEPGCQLNWPSGAGPCATAAQSASATPYIGRGTFEGFHDLIGLRGVNRWTRQAQTIAEFLSDYLPSYADSDEPLPLIVTGHSLGGCQTAPMALYLSSQGSTKNGVTIVPHSFAAPTAGNQAFANNYLNTLPNSRRWFNTFDLVPMAFGALSTMPQLWSVAPYSCGNPMPFWAPPLLDIFKCDVGGLQYAHEAGAANRQLNGAGGSTPNAKFPWGAQLEFQHSPVTGYWNLMVSQYSSVLGALSIPSWVEPAPASS